MINSYRNSTRAGHDLKSETNNKRMHSSTYRPLVNRMLQSASRGGVYSGGSAPGGMSVPGGVCSGGSAPRGVGWVPGPGGVCSWGGVPGPGGAWS